MTLDEAELADLAAWTAVRLDLELVAMSEGEYYASLRQFYGPVRAMIWVTALLMALAGILGGLNTLFAAFAARTRELGMLQALGYSRGAILLSLLQESMLAGAAGALIGALISYFLLHGNAVRFSMGVFELQVDAVTVFIGMLSGLALGFIGAPAASLSLSAGTHSQRLAHLIFLHPNPTHRDSHDENSPPPRPRSPRRHCHWLRQERVSRDTYACGQPDP